MSELWTFTLGLVFGFVLGWAIAYKPEISDEGKDQQREIKKQIGETEHQSHGQPARRVAQNRSTVRSANQQSFRPQPVKRGPGRPRKVA